jgi:hypothetical protein
MPSYEVRVVLTIASAAEEQRDGLMGAGSSGKDATEQTEAQRDLIV